MQAKQSPPRPPPNLALRSQDEKALKFLSTIPQKWRLFWAIESIGMSFALALVAIVYIGDSSPLLKMNFGILKQWPTWFIWGLNPAAVTLASAVLCSAIQAVCDYCSEAWVGVHQPIVGAQDTRVFIRFFATIKAARERVNKEPCFYATLAMRLAQVFLNWFVYVRRRRWLPLAFRPVVTTAGDVEVRLVMTDDKLVMICLNWILAIGVVAKALGVIRPRHEPVLNGRGPRYYSRGCAGRTRSGNCDDSRVFSLLVGWGIGYWFISLLNLLVCSWYGSGCRWNNTPSAVTVVGYLLIPCFLLGCVFMVADTNLLGTRFERFVKPATDRMRNRSRAEYWVMTSVFRDALVLWVGYCMSLSNIFS